MKKIILVLIIMLFILSGCDNLNNETSAIVKKMEDNYSSIEDRIKKLEDKPTYDESKVEELNNKITELETKNEELIKELEDLKTKYNTVNTNYSNLNKQVSAIKTSTSKTHYLTLVRMDGSAMAVNGYKYIYSTRGVSYNSIIVSKYLTIPINSNVNLSNYFSVADLGFRKEGKPMILSGNNFALCVNTLWKTTASKTGKDFNFNQKLTSDVTIYGYCNNQ